MDIGHWTSSAKQRQERSGVRARSILVGRGRIEFREGVHVCHDRKKTHGLTEDAQTLSVVHQNDITCPLSTCPSKASITTSGSFPKGRLLIIAKYPRKGSTPSPWLSPQGHHSTSFIDRLTPQFHCSMECLVPAHFLLTTSAARTPPMAERYGNSYVYVKASILSDVHDLFSSIS